MKRGGRIEKGSEEEEGEEGRKRKRRKAKRKDLSLTSKGEQNAGS